MLEIASLKALAPYVTGPMKAISVAKMMIWGFNKYQMRRLRRFLGTLELELDDGQAVQKLIEMANDEKHQDRVGQLLEKVRRADNVWTTCCLAGVVANYMRKGFLDTDDAMLADVLTELTDTDLELFTALPPLVKEAHEKVSQAEKNRVAQGQPPSQSDQYPQVRINEESLAKIPNKKPDDLQLVRTRIDRLLRAGAVSGDTGGYGRSGVAHGMFVWNDFSQQLFDFVNRFKDATE